MSAVSPDCETASASAPGRQRRLAVAELRGDLDVDRQAGQPLEQVSADHAGVGGGAAGDDLQALDLGEVEPAGASARPVDRVDVGRQRVLAGVRLLVDLLLHEVAVVALLDQRRPRPGTVRIGRSTGAPAASKIRAPLRSMAT